MTASAERLGLESAWWDVVNHPDRHGGSRDRKREEVAQCKAKDHLRRPCTPLSLHGSVNLPPNDSFSLNF